MRERIALVRPLTGQVIHSDLRVQGGSDTRSLSAPGDITFNVAPDWHDSLAEDGHPFFMKRGTLVVVERPNRTIRQVGLVDDLIPSHEGMEVSCGGFSMIAAQSGPWEGQQGWYTTKDPLELFYEVWDQVQSYRDANLGVRLVGDRRSGATVGSPGSARWVRAQRRFNELNPVVTKAEAALQEAERRLSSRTESMFKAAGLRRVGNVTVAEARPDDPEYKADSTIWIRESDRLAHVWTGSRWHSRPAANEQVGWHLSQKRRVDWAKADLDEAKYNLEPTKELLDQYESEAREEYSMYYWQNRDLGEVVEDLMTLGSFEFREEAAWTDDGLDLMLRTGVPTIGVRRDDLHLELGMNVMEQPVAEYGDLYTGVALFGAGEGSGVLSEQRDLGLDQVVRQILVETDKTANTRALTRAAANRLVSEIRRGMGLGFSQLVVRHTEAVPEGSFNVGDLLPIAGVIPGGDSSVHWVRVLEMTHVWGSQETEIEVEPV